MGRHRKILAILFFITLVVRLYFAFQTPYYDYDAYFNIRQINNIAEQDRPIINDELSYQGREHIFSPAFHYGLGLFKKILPDSIIFKVIPNLLACSMILITYLIAFKITEDKNISLLTSFLSAFLPQFLADTINTVSIYTITIPLTFLSIYFLLDIEKHNYTYFFAISVFLLSVIHPSSLILILSLLLYSFIMRLEKIKQERQEVEAILFSIFLVLWTQFILYKKAFLEYGLAIIWQNVPSEIFAEYFSKLSIVDAVLGVGLIPLIAGIYMVYKFLFRAKDKNTHLLISFVITTTSLSYFNLIPLKPGLMFLGIILTLLFSQIYKYLDTFLGRTRFSSYKKPVFITTIVLIIVTAIIPAISLANDNMQNTPTTDEIEALYWIKDNSPENTTILAPTDYGFLIEEVAERKAVTDLDFINAARAESRINATEKIYTTIYKTEAIKRLSRYDINYILLSKRIKNNYNIDYLEYAKEDECFKLIYDNDSQIYQAQCILEESS